MDEKRLLQRIQFLAHKIFIANEEGKEFIRLMKLLHVQTPTFPQQEDVIARHGGALAWAAYREGQLELWRAIEALAQNYLHKLEAENQAKENVK